MNSDVLVYDAVRTPFGKYGGALAGSRQVALGEAEVIMAGGVESMSGAPWVLPKPGKPFPARRRDRDRPPSRCLRHARPPLAVVLENVRSSS